MGVVAMEALEEASQDGRRAAASTFGIGAGFLKRSSSAFDGTSVVEARAGSAT